MVLDFGIEDVDNVVKRIDSSGLPELEFFGHSYGSMVFKCLSLSGIFIPQLSIIIMTIWVSITADCRLALLFEYLFAFCDKLLTDTLPLMLFFDSQSSKSFFSQVNAAYYFVVFDGD